MNFFSRHFFAGRSACVAAVLCAFASTATANIIGVDVQDFNATADGLDFVTVQSSETLRPGVWNLGLFANYAVNSLPYYAGSQGKRDAIHDTILGGDFNVGLGILPNWEVGLNLPQIISQSIKDDLSAQSRGQFSSTGNTEIRLSSKVHLLDVSSFGVAFIGSVNFSQIENSPYAGSNAPPIINGEIAIDTKLWERLAVALNAGYRWRRAGDPVPGAPTAPFGDQVIGSLAASYYVPSLDTKFIGELYGAHMAKNINLPSDRHKNSLESLIGAKFDVNDHLALHVGTGIGVIKGVATPDWRAYAGLNYTVGPFWGQKMEEAVVMKQPEPAAETTTAEEQVEAVTPTEMASAPPKKLEVYVISEIFFTFDSVEIVGLKEQIFNKVVDRIKMPPAVTRIVIEGHTDSMGSASYNKVLSQRRAETVQKILTEKYGLPEKLFAIEAYGEEKPIADNGNYQGRQQNRRVEIRLYRE